MSGALIGSWTQRAGMLRWPSACGQVPSFGGAIIARPNSIRLAFLHDVRAGARSRMAQGYEDAARSLATEHEAGAVSLEDEHAHDEGNRVVFGMNFGRLPPFGHAIVYCKMSADFVMCENGVRPFPYRDHRPELSL